MAFLRAINLGRVNRVPMGDLRVALTDAGFAEVTTHLQSGNVVLGSSKRSPAAVAYLAGDQSTWVTGQVLVIDAGLTATTWEGGSAARLSEGATPPRTPRPTAPRA